MNTKKFEFAIIVTLLLGTTIMLTVISCNEKKEAKVLEAKIENAEDAVKDMTKELKEEAKSHVDHELKNEYTSAGVYNLTQVDSPPLFDSSCKSADDPKICSEEKMLKFIKENAKFPRRENDNASSLEQVIIVVGKDGSVSDTKYVVSGNSRACKGCQQAAVDVIGMMGKWQPAMKSGKPVAVQMTVPIRFEA